jgi:hypothetical protein
VPRDTLSPVVLLDRERDLGTALAADDVPAAPDHGFLDAAARRGRDHDFALVGAQRPQGHHGAVLQRGGGRESVRVFHAKRHRPLTDPCDGCSSR